MAELTLSIDASAAREVIDDFKQEFDYLRWFFSNADFGPADSDVRYYMNRQYEKEGGVIPEGYEDE